MPDPAHRRTSLYLAGAQHTAPIPHAARVGPLIMTGGVNGKDPATDAVPPDLDGEVRQLFANLAAILAQAGASLDDVVKMDITMRDRAQRSALDPVWTELFPHPAHRPARHVSAGLLAGAMNIQAQATAYASDARRS
jgi:2-iminobutanoate/2-iminopropanoate deaminase